MEDMKKIGKIYEIKKIPTFIVFDQNENELGRIIEKKKSNSLEEDILEIISNN